MHTCGWLRRSVTAVVERWILTVPLSPGLAAAVAATGAVCAPALDAANARTEPAAITVAPATMERFVRHLMVTKAPSLSGDIGCTGKRRGPGNCYARSGPGQAPGQARARSAAGAARPGRALHGGALSRWPAACRPARLS